MSIPAVRPDAAGGPVAEVTGHTIRGRGVRRRWRRVVVAATVGLGLLAGGLPASAAVYAGNYCGNGTWRVSVTGGTACTYLNYWSASYLSVQLGALDSASDGLSIRNTTRIDQYSASNVYLGSSPNITVTNSAGAVTTNFGANQLVARRAGAATARVVITGTRLNAPNGAVYNSYSYVWSYYWPN